MPTIRSTRVVVGTELRPATVRFEDGRIVEIGNGLADRDFGDLLIMPGLVDSHVHVNEPGRTEWEGFATATRAAAAGGTTTIVDMPLNSIPPTVDVESLQVKRRAARSKLSVDTAFWGGIVPGSHDSIDGLVDAGVCGFKAFMVDSGVPEFPPLSPTDLERAMQHVSRTDVPLLLHAEDPALLLEAADEPRHYATYSATRPPASEAVAIERSGELAAVYGALVHILHVSSAEAAAAISRHPGLTGETCPHYLFFCAEDVEDGATQFKCAPPIRSREHRQALWDALSDGLLQMIVSDHSPAPADVKETESGDFVRAWGGIGSLQLRLQASWTAGSQRGVRPESLSAWLSTNPAKLAGLDDRKGAIGEGLDGDFVVFDPDGRTLVKGADLHHRHPITPYEGLTLRGAVVATILRGHTVYDEGAVSDGLGIMMERHG